MACGGSSVHQLEDGYDAERFEKEVDPRLLCPICLKVLNEPMQCRNQHYFCAFCISSHLQKNSETCPMCQDHLTSEILIKAPRILKELICSLKINCDYARRGCPVFVQVQFLTNHMKDCEYVPTPCTNPGCVDIVNHCDLKQHATKVCHFRPVMICNDCGLEVQNKLSCLHPCVMKREIDSLAAKADILQNDVKEMKLVQNEFMMEVRNMIIGVKAVCKDAVEDLHGKINCEMNNMVDNMKHLNHGILEELRNKISDESEERCTKVAQVSDEIANIRKDLEDARSKLANNAGGEISDVSIVERRRFGRHAEGDEVKKSQIPLQRPRLVEVGLGKEEKKTALKKCQIPLQRPRLVEVGLGKEEKKTAELYRSVVAILNKLTAQKLKTLVEQMELLNIDTLERLQGVVNKIFEKALKEPNFSAVYANMCRCLFPIKVAAPDGGDILFKKVLLRRCQDEFEKELSGNESRERALGNIKLMGELFKLKLLTKNIMHDCIYKLLKSGQEGDLACAGALLINIGKDLDSENAKPRMQQYFDQIERILDAKKITPRVKFALQDAVDLRRNNWVPL